MAPMSDPPRTAETFFTRHQVPIGACLIILGLFLAWRVRFLQDDAFISFTYARNLVEGRGLTWFGERVEGYTNFLWVLWLALALRLGIDPAAAATFGGLLSFLVAMAATARTSVLVLRSAAARLFALAFLATNFTFVAFATGGLETMFLTAWVALALHSTQALLMARRPPSPGRRPPGSPLLPGRPHPGRRPAVPLAILSLLFAAMLLTRLDAAPVVAALGAFALFALYRHQAAEHFRPGLLALLLPGGVAVGVWLGWKLAYYGSVLPNTYWAKLADHQGLLAAGWLYLGRFLHGYAIWPLLALGTLLALAGRQRPRDGLLRLAPSSAVVAVSWAYVVGCGGDFMEFRFLVPSLPALGLILAFLLVEPGRTAAPAYRGPAHRGPAYRLLAAASLALLVAASALHAHRFVDTTRDLALDSIHRLRTFYGVYPDGDWSRLGTALTRELGDLEPTIALTAVGAIPYYSRLDTVDIHGLNDREIARRGLRVAAEFRRPGHQRWATVEQLRARGVHFVFGHPTEVPLTVLGDRGRRAQLAGWVRRTFPFEALTAETPILVAIPISESAGLLAWYLTPAERFDRRIRERGWPAVRLRLR